MDNTEPAVIVENRQFHVGDIVEIIGDDLFYGCQATVTGCYWNSSEPYVTTDFSARPYYEFALKLIRKAEK